ncbi:MAG: SufD family Fe-S cluster assembly protein [Enterobacterales bacterium]|nr:SufD family Fe-S cluster assembly protein [Enterobacterales bacterium]
MNLKLQNNCYPISQKSDIEQLKEQLTANQKSELDWLLALRHAEIENFSQQALAHRKMEHWKYNDVYFLMDKTFELYTDEYLKPDILEQVKEKIEQEFKHTQSIIFTFIDGHWIEALSSNAASSSVSSTLFSQANAEQISFINKQLKANQQSRNSFIQLNNGLCADGLLIEVSKQHKIEQPIILLQFKTQAAQNHISGCQILVKAEQSSQFQLAEYGFVLKSNTSEKKQALHLSLAQTQIYLAPCSQCQYYRIHAESEDACQIARCVISLDTQAELKAFFYAEGSQINKLDLDVLHIGQHSTSDLVGVYLPRFEQNIDFHTTLEHRVANCQSREVFRGIMADSSTATFNGKIHIFQDAQKTDAQLNNKNLLLTNQATINTKPELEIYADDVVCAHGATVAEIDADAIYFLQTRGIGQTRAKKMLSVGFIQELIEKMPESAIRQDITQRAQICLSNIQ